MLSKTNSLLFVLLIVLAGFWLSSCHNGNENGPGVFVPVPVDSSALGKINHNIGKGLVSQYRRRLDARIDSLSRFSGLFITKSEGFNKPALLELLKDPKCTGIRIYYGIASGQEQKQRDSLKLIIVGVDANGKDLYIVSKPAAAAGDVSDTQFALEYGQCCQEQPVEN